MSAKTIAEVLKEHFPIDEWKGASTQPTIRCTCNCGSNFYIDGWARHVEKILMDLPVLASSAGVSPKAELQSTPPESVELSVDGEGRIVLSVKLGKERAK